MTIMSGHVRNIFFKKTSITEEEPKFNRLLLNGRGIALQLYPHNRRITEAEPKKKLHDRVGAMLNRMYHIIASNGGGEG